MSSIFYILIALLLLGVLITVHEFGHFIAARIGGIEVKEFSIGFGPKLYSRTGKKGTKFSLRAIPLGGFCAFYGEDDATGATKDDPRAYNNQSVWKRMFSIIMGPAMNFVLAFVVVVGFYWIGGVQEITGVEPFISEVSAAGPAYDAGLKDGDIIVSVNGVNMLDGTTDTLLDTLAGYREGEPPMQLVVNRGGEMIETELTPYFNKDENRYMIGVYIGGRYLTSLRSVSFGEAVTAGFDYCVYAGSMVFDALGQLVRGQGVENVTGPVGTVSIVSEAVQQNGLEGFVSLLVVISINLGIMNLLPIPGLDGMRFIFAVIEAIRRKPIPAEKEAMIHLAGYVLLFGLMIFFTFNDVLRLFQ